MTLTTAQLNAVISNLPKSTLAALAASPYPKELFIKALFYQVPDELTLLRLSRDKKLDNLMDSGMFNHLTVDRIQEDYREQVREVLMAED